MLACYFDESENFGESPVLVVAGFCGGSQQWEFFAKEWLAVLKSYGLQSPFKMQHFARWKRQFRTFADVKREPLLRDLLDVICKRAMMGFGCVVVSEAYDRLIAGEAKNKIGSPYALAAAGCFWCVGNWARRYKHPDPIAHFFDGGHRNAGEALAVHTKHLADEQFRKGWKLGPISFDTDDRLIPLQAADLFAYESLRRCSASAIKAMSEDKPLTQENLRYPIRKLLSGRIPLMVRLLDEQTLTELRDNQLRSIEPDYGE
jgi:hypothetical protein